MTEVIEVSQKAQGIGLSRPMAMVCLTAAINCASVGYDSSMMSSINILVCDHDHAAKRKAINLLYCLGAELSLTVTV